MNKLVLTLSVAGILLSACGSDEEVPEEGVVEDGTEQVEETPQEEVVGQEEGITFQEQAEANAMTYPASPGANLVTNEEVDFSGMEYYFAGTLISAGAADAFDGNTIWLLQNDEGYTIPVEMLEGDVAGIGSYIEVWGMLTGDGYNFPNLENDVEETGYLKMTNYTVDGEQIM